MYDQELLVMYKTIKYFLFMINGRTSTVFIDQRLITYAFKITPVCADFGSSDSMPRAYW